MIFPPVPRGTPVAPETERLTGRDWHTEVMPRGNSGQQIDRAARCCHLFV